ncbi:MAG: hypothetical protein ABEJ46_01655 [Gemmatimonadota bacterium]
MNDEPAICRELDELDDADCCEPCHEATASGQDRLRLVELDDGRMVRVCHVAFDALREAGLLTAEGSMEEPDHSR